MPRDLDYGRRMSAEASENTAGSLTLAELASRIPGAELVGSPDHRVDRLVHPAEVASSEEISLLMSEGALQLLQLGKIQCAIVGSDLHANYGDQLAGLAGYLHVERPRHALGEVSRIFPRLRRPGAGVHPTAFVDETAAVSPDAVIGPHCVVLARATIGLGTWLRDSVTVGEGTIVGDHCIFQSGVRIADGIEIGDRVILNQNAVVGGDGFSFVTPERGSVEAARSGERETGAHQNHRIERIESLGTVKIGDDVEIGACTCIDRAALGATVIRAGTKIDNLCQIAHNVEIGENCLFASHNGIAGSTKIGDRVVWGGQAGCADHLTIGDDAVLMGRTGVITDLEGGKVYAGMPARPAQQAMKTYALIDRLSDMRRELRSLKKQIADLG